MGVGAERLRPDHFAPGRTFAASKAKPGPDDGKVPGPTIIQAAARIGWSRGYAQAMFARHGSRLLGPAWRCTEWQVWYVEPDLADRIVPADKPGGAMQRAREATATDAQRRVSAKLARLSQELAL